MVRQMFQVLKCLMWERSPAVTPQISCLLNSNSNKFFLREWKIIILVLEMRTKVIVHMGRLFYRVLWKALKIRTTSVCRLRPTNCLHLISIAFTPTPFVPIMAWHYLKTTLFSLETLQCPHSYSYCQPITLLCKTA